MYDLALAVMGNGNTTYNNAADLLTDYLPDNHVVFVPSYINSEGMKNVWKVLQDQSITYERVKKSKLIEILEQTETKSREFVILNSDGIENEISRCLQAKIPVSDLTRGLYRLTELPPAASEANAEEILTAALSSDTPENNLASQGVTAPRITNFDTFENIIANLTSRVERLEKAMSISSGETNWEPAPLANPPAQESKEDATTGSEGIAEGTVPYWKSKRGKLRKAGNSKARPGEEMVYLTEEEIAKLD